MTSLSSQHQETKREVLYFQDMPRLVSVFCQPLSLFCVKFTVRLVNSNGCRGDTAQPRPLSLSPTRSRQVTKQGLATDMRMRTCDHVSGKRSRAWTEAETARYHRKRRADAARGLMSIWASGRPRRPRVAIDEVSLATKEATPCFPAVVSADLPLSSPANVRFAPSYLRDDCTLRQPRVESNISEGSCQNESESCRLLHCFFYQCIFPMVR